VTEHSAARPVRVLLVEDQALVRAGFRMVIDSQPDLTVVGEAGDGVSGVHQARTSRPDLVVMDVRMPVLRRRR
jgi:DNA-binding NarL/FixJ family response regulator